MIRNLGMLVSLAACAPTEPTVTTWDEVAPVVSKHCASCHQPGGIGAFLDLTRGASAADWAPQIAEAVASGRMPPFPAEGGCEPVDGFMNDPRLDPAELKVILDWVEAGAQLGEHGGSTAPPEVPALEPASATLGPRNPVRVPAASEAEDSFVCVLLDTGLDGAVWLDGLQVMPDTTEVTHHVQLNRVPRVWAAYNDAQDGAVDGSYPCFGDLQATNSVLLGGWIPGSTPIRYPEGSGVPLYPHQALVARIHYHGAEAEILDEPSFRVHWRDTPPQRRVDIQLHGNRHNGDQGLLAGPDDPGEPSFHIPAGARQHTETMRFPLRMAPDVELPSFMVVPHMHLAGTRMTAWLEHEDGTEVCLIDVPNYDFDWQLLYEVHLGHPDRTLRHGDHLRIACTYDNSMHNPDLAAALREAGLDAPIDLMLGDGSLDEMCLLGLGVLSP